MLILPLKRKNKYTTIFKTETIQETKKVIKQEIKIAEANLKYWKFNLKISKNKLGESFCKWMIETLKYWKIKQKNLAKTVQKNYVISAKR